MTAEKKIAQKRLTLLQVAERIRNVSGWPAQDGERQ